MSDGNKRAWPHVLEELFGRLLSPSRHVTASAPHVRDTVSVDRMLLYFVLASIPALLAGLWNLGTQTLQVMLHNQVAALPGWQWSLFTSIGFDYTSQGSVASLLLGLIHFLPLLVAALAVGIFWELVFATLRGRPVDPGWLMASWLYVLLLPATLPLGLAALGMSFGVVFGKHIFGGTGRYLVSPALVGVLFLQFSYPGIFVGAGTFVPVPDFIGASTWSVVAAGGLEEASAQGVSWARVLLGQETGPLGTSSALLCLAGAAFLVYRGAASGRTVLGALIGMLVMSLLLNMAGSEDPVWQLPWHWHLALGSFAFGIAFLATDPTPSAMTAEGRWIQGILIGFLTVLIRALNPSHPEGTLYAILLVTLAIPIIDYTVIRVRLTQWRRRRRTEA